MDSYEVQRFQLFPKNEKNILCKTFPFLYPVAFDYTE